MTDEQVEKITDAINEASMNCGCSGISDSQVEKIVSALYDISDELSKIRWELDWSSRHVDEKLGKIYETIDEMRQDVGESLQNMSEDIENIALSKAITGADEEDTTLENR